MFKKIIILLLALPAIFSAKFASASRFTESLNKTIENVGPGGEKDISIVIGNIIQGILGLLGLVFAVLLIYGGTIYMISRGDTKKVEQAKNIIRNSIIGIVIIAASYSLAYFVTAALESTAK